MRVLVSFHMLAFLTLSAWAESKNNQLQNGPAAAKSPSASSVKKEAREDRKIQRMSKEISIQSQETSTKKPK